MSVVILYGTETGNSELVADAIADVLSVDHDPSIYDMSEFAVEDLDAEDFLVVICSTYGEGELPPAPSRSPTNSTPWPRPVRPTVRGVRARRHGLRRDLQPRR